MNVMIVQSPSKSTFDPVHLYIPKILGEAIKEYNTPGYFIYKSWNVCECLNCISGKSW